MRELKKGSLGMLLLQLLSEKPSYGYELGERLRARSDGALQFDEGAIYPLLHDYARRGLVSSYWEADVTPAAGVGVEAEPGGASARKGPPRRYYRLTDAGRQALEVHRAEWQAFARAVGSVLSGSAPNVATTS